MKKLSNLDLIKLVTDSFEAERTGNVEWGRCLISDDFKRTAMYIHNGTVFPVLNGKDLPLELETTYAVKGREFHVWNVAANENTQTVFVELAEVEPSGGKKHVWPYTLVCQIEDGKIKHTRHYGDPAVWEEGVSVEMVEKAVGLI